jgi:hypothetical protein
VFLEPEREAEIATLVARLRRLVPREGAHLTLPEGPSSGGVIGNRLGYLRLGIELLTAALHPLPGSESEPARIAPELGSLLTADSAETFDLCELDESIASRPPAEAHLGPIGHILAGVALVVLVILLFVGTAFLWRWLLG